MPSALIVYASLTGNTQEIAQLIQKALNQLGVKVTLRECSQVYASEFQNMDICVVATYTYGSQGDLPYEIEDLFFDLQEINLTGKVFGVAGSGEEFYDYYCKSVDDFDRQFSRSGAHRGADSLKIELKATPKDHERIQKFATDLVEAYKKQNSGKGNH